MRGGRRNWASSARWRWRRRWTRLAGPGTALKWPNDVLRGGAKLAGILLERLGDGAVLAGIGINVAHHPDDMPYPVTSLRALGCAADADAVLDAVAGRARRPVGRPGRRTGSRAVLARGGARPGARRAAAGSAGAGAVAGRSPGCGRTAPCCWTRRPGVGLVAGDVLL